MTSFGVVLPQTELGSDVRDLRRYALAVQDLGFRHVMAYDHVLGADPTVHSTQYGYDVDTTFHEPLVTFGYLAALTELELFTGVIILPQRQTALVAKQSAQVDVLSGGRLRLGVGVGWNKVEYDALGQVLLVARQANRRADLASSSAVDGAVRDIRRRLRHHHRRRSVAAADPTVRPDLDGAQVAAGYRRAGRLADGWSPSSVLDPTRRGRDDHRRRGLAPLGGTRRRWACSAAWTGRAISTRH